MAGVRALVSFMRRGAIAQGDLVLAPAALLPVDKGHIDPPRIHLQQVLYFDVFHRC